MKNNLWLWLIIDVWVLIWLNTDDLYDNEDVAENSRKYCILDEDCYI